jgi:hypothetical protein
VTKTIGLHLVVVTDPKPSSSGRLGLAAPMKAPRCGSAFVGNWELISDKTLDWWVPRLGRIKSVSGPSAHCVNRRLRQRHGAASLADARRRVSGRRLRRAGAEPLVSPWTGRTWIEHRQDRARVDCDESRRKSPVCRWAKLTSTTDIVVEARERFRRR